MWQPSTAHWPRATGEARSRLHSPSWQRLPMKPGRHRQAPVSGSQRPPCSHGRQISWQPSPQWPSGQSSAPSQSVFHAGWAGVPIHDHTSGTVPSPLVPHLGGLRFPSCCPGSPWGCGTHRREAPAPGMAPRGPHAGSGVPRRCPAGCSSCARLWSGMSSQSCYRKAWNVQGQGQGPPNVAQALAPKQPQAAPPGALWPKGRARERS